MDGTTKTPGNVKCTESTQAQAVGAGSVSPGKGAGSVSPATGAGNVSPAKGTGGVSPAKEPVTLVCGGSRSLSQLEEQVLPMERSSSPGLTPPSSLGHQVDGHRGQYQVVPQTGGTGDMNQNSHDSSKVPPESEKMKPRDSDELVVSPCQPRFAKFLESTNMSKCMIFMYTFPLQTRYNLHVSKEMYCTSNNSSSNGLTLVYDLGGTGCFDVFRTRPLSLF